jgi:hypothetical protein
LREVLSRVADHAFNRIEELPPTETPPADSSETHVALHVYFSTSRRSAIDAYARNGLVDDLRQLRQPHCTEHFFRLPLLNGLIQYLEFSHTAMNQKVGRRALRVLFERSKNVVQMLESSDKLHTKSKK